MSSDIILFKRYFPTQHWSCILGALFHLFPETRIKQGCLKRKRKTKRCHAGELFAFHQSCDHACLFDVSVNWHPIRSANSAAGSHSLRNKCDHGQSLVTPQSTCSWHLLPPIANQSGLYNLITHSCHPNLTNHVKVCRPRTHMQIHTHDLLLKLSMWRVR